MSAYEDLVGNRIGIWRVLEFLGTRMGNARRKPIYRVRCECCGAEYERRSDCFDKEAQYCKACAPSVKKRMKLQKPSELDGVHPLAEVMELARRCWR